MNIGEKIVVDGVEWCIEVANAKAVECVMRNERGTGRCWVIVSKRGVRCDTCDCEAIDAPIEVVEAAIRIWKEMNS